AKGRFLMVGDGTTHYRPSYIKHLTDAMQQAIESVKTRGKAYLIADEKSIAIKELVQRIGRAIGKDVNFTHVPYAPVWAAALACELAGQPLKTDTPLFRRRIDWIIQNRSVKIDAARRDFGYNPNSPLDECLRDTADWYRQQGFIRV